MGDSYAACAKGHSAREEAAPITITFTWVIRPAESVTRFCRTGVRSVPICKNTWAVIGAAGANIRLYQKLHLEDTSWRRNANKKVEEIILLSSFIF